MHEAKKGQLSHLQGSLTVTKFERSQRPKANIKLISNINMENILIHFQKDPSIIT